MVSINIEALKAERAALVAANEAATSWGVAVGARHERIKEIDRTLALAPTPSLTNPNPKREDERVEKSERTLEHEIWEAIRTHSSPTMSPSDKPGWTSVHGGQSGVIVWERDGKPHVIAEIMRIIQREAASARPSNANPVRAALEPFAAEAKDWDPEAHAGKVFHDTLTIPDGYTRLKIGDLRRARAALQASTPTGEGEEAEGDTEQRHEGGRVTVLPTVLWRALDAEADIWVQETDVTGWIAKMSQDGRSREKIEAIVRLCFEEGFYRGAVAARDRRSIHDSLAGAAALAHPPQGGERDGWKPIKTAPKDGAHILAIGKVPSCDDYTIEVRETHWMFYGEGSMAHADYTRGEGPSGSWYWSEPIHNWGSSWSPTHWMPLPTAPTSASESSGEEA